MAKHITADKVPPEVLRRQIDAVTRTVVLLRKDGKIRFDDIMHELADAEIRAEYVCGFVELYDQEDEKEYLKENILEKGVATIDDEGFLTLTAIGQERAKVELPAPIEEQLVDQV